MPAFPSLSAFFAMGGYALYVWLAVAITVIAPGWLIVHTLWQHRKLLQAIRNQQARERRIRQARERKKEDSDVVTP